MTDYVAALIRTWVPVLVGTGISWLATRGITLDPDTKAATIAALTGLAIGLYYTAVRTAARRWPALEVLNGYKATPTYTATELKDAA